MSHFSNLPVSSLRQFDILLARLLVLLPEGMQDIDAIGELGNVDHPPRPLNMHPDFLHSGTHTWHRFPVRGLLACLDAVQFVAGYLPGVHRESPEIILAAANKVEWLREEIYKYLDNVATVPASHR
jgi:hypothetical protein